MSLHIMHGDFETLNAVKNPLPCAAAHLVRLSACALDFALFNLTLRPEYSCVPVSDAVQST